jgi:thioesterase domain-containing protein/acyl carrier protein
LSMSDTAGGSVIGKPIPDLQLYILDQQRQPVPIGVAGELYVGGAGVARGYLSRPELTSERFIPDPFSSRPGARLYKTGDLARFLADGDVEYLGRIDHQVKIRGFRIELGEVESALAQYPAIRQAVVVVREDPSGDKRLVAYLVSSEEDLDTRELRAFLAKSLPEYMVPTGFSVVPTLPLTPSGKVDRKALPAPVLERKDRFDIIRPRNQTESLLASLFQEILNVDAVSIRDDFFELGGQSLMAARLVSQINETIGREVPLGALFRAATVESLAQLIEQESELGNDPVVIQIQRGDSGRLPFFAIVPPGEESLGYAILARHMGPEQTVYKIQGHAPVTHSKRPYSEQEMRDLTSEYIAAMRSVQPSGPYCLGGECDGTHISEQIVLSLEAQGEEVGLFAIFDTWVLQHSQRRWLSTTHYYGQRIQELKRLNFTELLVACKGILEDKVGVLIGKKSAPTEWPETYWPRNFIPWQFRAPVVLFKRPKQPFYYVKDSQMGWGARTQSGVEIHEIEFSHLEILREPHVRIFGEKLAERIVRLSQRDLSPRSVPESSEPARLTTPIERS